MYIVKILKRRDASSVIVAVVLAMITMGFLPYLTANIAGTLSGAQDGYYMGSGFPGADWRTAYLQPFVSALLQVVILEVVLRLVVLFRSVLVRRAK